MQKIVWVSSQDDEEMDDEWDELEVHDECDDFNFGEDLPIWQIHKEIKKYT